MQLEELKNIWQNYDSNLDNKIEINHQFLKEVSINKIQSLLASFKWSNIFELVISLIFTLIFMPVLLSFIQSNSNNISLFLSGFFLLFLAIASIIYNIFIISQIVSIKYDEPILSVQKRVERIKLLEAQEINSLLLIIPLFAISFTAVALKLLIHVNLFEYLSLFWGIQLMGTLVVSGIIVFLLKKFPNKKLASAQNFLKEIKDLEKE